MAKETKAFTKPALEYWAWISSLILFFNHCWFTFSTSVIVTGTWHFRMISKKETIYSPYFCKHLNFMKTEIKEYFFSCIYICSLSENHLLQKLSGFKKSPVFVFHVLEQCYPWILKQGSLCSSHQIPAIVTPLLRLFPEKTPLLGIYPSRSHHSLCVIMCT